MFSEWRALRAFGALESAFHDIVFYSEGSGDWPHLGPIVQCLVQEYGRRISYLTSDSRDPGLSFSDDKFRAFQVGSGSARTVLFRTIACRHFVMSLPDLETFHLKRSTHPVHYIYVFHSINSTHTAYRKGAFDAFDTVLCVGPHHVGEIRRTEEIYGLRRKTLVEHGSVKLDAVLAQFAAGERVTSGTSRQVLVAPSWGECSLIEQPLGIVLLDTLLAAGYMTVLRVHPMTVRRCPKLLRELQQRYSGSPSFLIEQDMNAVASWMKADLMISDWSGAATEFAFALQKPVIFINTTQKLNNAEWSRIGLRGFEDLIRSEIGRVVEPHAVQTVPQAVEECCRDANVMRERIIAARDRWIFNCGRSSTIGAGYLASLPA